MTKILKSYKGIPYEVAKQKLETLLDALDAIEYWSDIVSKCESGCGGVKVQRAIPQDF